jgi:cytochrome c1
MSDLFQRFRNPILAAALLPALAWISCGPSSTEKADAHPAATAAPPATASASADGLTPFQLEHGIGPVTEPVVVDGIDKAMAHAGAEIFEHKCAACHKMADRYVGPALGEVTKRRSPTFVMNMVLNPQGMVAKHPVSRKLLGEYFTPMPNLNLSKTEARELLEYLRTQAH